MEVEMERFQQSLQKQEQNQVLGQNLEARVVQPSERQELTTAGPKHSDLDGMS